LQSSARMLGPLPLVAMRQEQHDAVGTLPLRVAAGDELVDDDLRAVGEVAELRLPEHERFGIVERVAELEAEHGEFGERAVVDGELRLILADVLERRVALAGVLVDPDRMSLRKRPAPAVLAAEAHGSLLQNQRAQCERLAEGPVDLLAALDHVHLALDE